MGFKKRTTFCCEFSVNSVRLFNDGLKPVFYGSLVVLQLSFKLHGLFNICLCLDFRASHSAMMSVLCFTSTAVLSWIMFSAVLLIFVTLLYVVFLFPVVNRESGQEHV